jgi:hypothetical protein
VGEGFDIGIGNDTGRPSMMGLGHPPAEESNPFRLNTTFNAASETSARSLAYSVTRAKAVVPAD